MVRWFQNKIDQVEQNASEAWKEAAHRRVRWLAHNKSNFTSEDVLTWLGQRGYKTKDTRALGAIIQHYNREGWIKATGWTACKRRHDAPIRVWTSLIKEAE